MQNAMFPIRFLLLLARAKNTRIMHRLFVLGEAGAAGTLLGEARGREQPFGDDTGRACDWYPGIVQTAAWWKPR